MQRIFAAWHLGKARMFPDPESEKVDTKSKSGACLPPIPMHRGRPLTRTSEYARLVTMHIPIHFS